MDNANATGKRSDFGIHYGDCSGFCRVAPQPIDSAGGWPDGMMFDYRPRSRKMATAVVHG